MPDPFITVQDLSDFLGRDVTADNGALMAVDAACDTIRDITEQDFNQTTSTVVLDGTDTDALLLPQRPVIAAGTVTVNGGTVSDYVGPTPDGFLYRGSGVGSSGFSAKWPAGRQNIRVTYDHGYTFGGTANEIPRSVRMVAIMIASRLIVQGVAQSETVGDVIMGYGMAASDLTDGEKAILYGYLAKRSF